LRTGREAEHQNAEQGCGYFHDREVTTLPGLVIKYADDGVVGAGAS